MGVYVFRSKYHPVIKIGSHIGSNAWGRVINKGFFSVIRPVEITEKVDVEDLELLYWFPSLSVTEEHLLHYKLREFRVVGEWFTLAALEKIPEFVTLPNRADSCIAPVCVQQSRKRLPSPTPLFTKVLDLTMETVTDVADVADVMDESIKHQKIVKKKEIRKKIPKKVIYRTINTLTHDEIQQCISLMESCCVKCGYSMSYKPCLWEDMQLCVGCFTQLSQKKYDIINAYVYELGYHDCTFCKKSRTDYSAFSKEWVNIWSKGRILSFSQYTFLPVDQIINIIDNGALVCLSCYSVICRFEYKYGYRKHTNYDLYSDIHDYDEKMAPIFGALSGMADGKGRV
jgi:hypothetical protein